MMQKPALVSLALASLFAWTPAPRAAVLESPAQDATLSGIGFISGWKCHAGTITVTLDGGDPLLVAQHQERGDLLIEKTCGDTIAHGFIRQINWGYVGDGEHEVVAYDDGVEFARAVFTVGTTGEEFLEEAQRRSIIENFPTRGEDTVVEWNESTQHFELLTVWASPLKTVYDREWWRAYNADLAAGTYATREFLYAAEPDVDACEPGELAPGAKNRALEAANHIRRLHGLPAVRYSALYSPHMQAAALLQAAGGTLTHGPDPRAACYTEAGATGSRTSNLSGPSQPGAGGADEDPVKSLVGWVNNTTNAILVAVAGYRRWVLNPFAVHFAYGQVDGYAAQKVFAFAQEPVRVPRIQPEFVAVPFEVYPFNLMEDGAPWSISVIEDKHEYWNNQHDYFSQATMTVTRLADAVELATRDRYTDALTFGIPNFLSWQVDGWEYDTLYEVVIDKVVLQDGETRRYVYPVLIERAELLE